MTDKPDNPDKPPTPPSRSAKPRTRAKSATPATKTTGAEKPASNAPPRRKRTVKAPEPTHDELAERSYLIAERAYHIYLTEGGGDPVDHWLRAESELKDS